MIMPAVQARAQNEISTFESLKVDLWPDYDRPSVLVLLTGILPAETRFPATIILPLPKDAQLNAVARIDGRDGIMKDDISVTPGPSDMLMFITPDLQFRVEYYVPYTVNGSQRSYDYSWKADITVNKLQLKIQQPKAATSFKLNPLAKNITTQMDGLTYHVFPPKAVLAGQLFSAHMEYDNKSFQLYTDTSPPAPEENPFPENLSSKAIDSQTNWTIPAIILGGLIVITGLLWLIISHRNQMETQKSPIQKPLGTTQVKFCRKCGEPVDKKDQWCAYCGAHL